MERETLIVENGLISAILAIRISAAYAVFRSKIVARCALGIDARETGLLQPGAQGFM
jgi:hypothetical protein